MKLMRLILNIALALLCCGVVLAQQSYLIDQNGAVGIARKFVLKKGYAIENGEKIPETSRSSLLDPDPPIALVRGMHEERYWSVQFYFLDKDEDQIVVDKEGYSLIPGREIRVSLDGKKVWLERQPILLPISVYGDCTSP